MPKDVLFIWIPRTGGTSISTALGLHVMAWPENLCEFKNEGWVSFKHMSITDLMDAGIVSEEFFRRAFKFTCVRNPWDRIVSVFHRARMDNDLQGALSRYKYFEEFVLDLPNIRIDPPGIYLYKGFSSFAPQVSWIRDKRKRIFVDFIMRYENLEEDFRKLCSILGISVELPHLYPSEHRPYWQYYTPTLRDIVAEIYREDIKTFGYSFSVIVSGDGL